MACMLDTVHCVHLLMRSPQVTPRSPMKDCLVSAVVTGELHAGALQSLGSGHRRNREALLDFLSAVQVCAVDEHVAQAYARMRAGGDRPTADLGGNDLWVAAHALALELPLVTHRPQLLAEVPGLVTENWLQALE